MSNLCYRKNEEIVKVEAVEEREDGKGAAQWLRTMDDGRESNT